ncbi:MAG: hypothetical protein JJU20_00285 [Opitutales bacterium]|nr:hypothetical protein [Opitutales bacterium]
MDNQFEVIIFLAYLGFLLVIGFAFSKWSKGTRDYFISGSKATWWLVGMSVFMSGISAYTFTGNAGIAYEAGWTIMVQYIGGIFAYVLNAIFLAHLFRQTRCVTFPEIARNRFGKPTEMLYSLISVVNFPLYSGIMIWAVSSFVSVITGWPLEWLIVSLGAVVLIYSTTGGRWAVLSTDFIQGILMMGLSILITVLCLRELGGFAGMFAMIEAKGLSEQFAVVNPPELRVDGVYGPLWIAMNTLVVIAVQCSFQVATRYFSVKTGWDARKAALLGGAMFAMGTIVWFIPPVAAHLLYSDQVMAMTQISSPREASFAVVSMNLLPTGMIGMMIVAMMAASMSTLDTGLNNTCAIVIRNLVPEWRRWLGQPQPNERHELMLSRTVTIILGMGIITSALYFASVEGRGMFEVAINLLAIVGIPMAIPMIFGIFIRRIPQWGIFTGMGFGLLPSIISMLFPELLNYQTRTMWIFIGSSVGTLISMPFWRLTSVVYREKVKDFFERMHTPIQFEEEIGQSEDVLQLKRIGLFSLCVGGFVLVLLVLPNDAAGRIGIFCIGALISLIGIGMMHAARRARLRALAVFNLQKTSKNNDAT